MFTRKAVGAVAFLSLAAPAAVVATAGSAEAARYYSSCSALTKDFRHGVAKSAAAAQRQVNQGYGRPAYGDRARAVYWENYKRLDRDRDGTACER
jgi:Excalibur calcium-binding domain